MHAWRLNLKTMLSGDMPERAGLEARMEFNGEMLTGPKGVQGGDSEDVDGKEQTAPTIRRNGSLYPTMKSSCI